jgi:membrane-bound metal-dependent hydrolase YbcI (DUF457 family)
MTKPVNAKTHGVIDYAFSGIQLFGSKLLGLNKKTVKTYQFLGTGFLGVNALTATPVGLKKVISIKAHQKADASFLTALSLLTFSSMINHDKRSLEFHLGFLSLGIAHYLLSDYKSQP